MRTLKLSHEEVALLLRALGIPENQVFQIKDSYIKNLVNVRGVDSITSTRKETDAMTELENKFCDLLLDIKNGSKDV